MTHLELIAKVGGGNAEIVDMYLGGRLTRQELGNSWEKIGLPQWRCTWKEKAGEKSLTAGEKVNPAEGHLTSKKIHVKTWI